MTSMLEEFVGRNVSIITLEGRQFVGILKGFDQITNLILAECHERIFSMDEGMQQVQLGLQIIRGDSVVIIGEVDEALDSQIDFSDVYANPFPPIQH